jgi:hypothetical protein
VCCCRFWCNRPVLFWGWGNSHSNFRSLCADITQLPGAETERV